MAISFGVQVREVEGDEGRRSIVETPRELVPSLVGWTPMPVVDSLRNAAARAGLVDFDFGPAIERAASLASPVGWMTGAGPLQIVNAILAQTGNPGLESLRVTDAGILSNDAAYGRAQEDSYRYEAPGFFSDALSFAKEALTSPPALVFYALAGANAAGLIGSSASASTVIPASVESAFGATEGLGMAGSFETLSAGAVPLTGGAFGATEGLGMAGSFESLSAGAVPLTRSGASILTNAATGIAKGAASGAASSVGNTAAGATLATTAAALGKGVLAGITGAVANALTDAPATDAPTVIAPTTESTLTSGRLILGALAGTAVIGTVVYIAKRNKK